MRINTDDRDVVKYLKYFTFLSHEEILELEKQVAEAPKKTKALGAEMTKLVHGEEALEQAIKISVALFSGSVAELTASEIEQGFKDVPSVERTAEDTVLIDLLVESKISPSKRQAREDVTNGAIYVNGERTQALDYVVTENDRIEGKFTIIRAVRRNIS